jgi:hypothetical protein
VTFASSSLAEHLVRGLHGLCVSTVMSFVAFGCSSTSGTGTTASGGSSGTDGSVGSGGTTSTGGSTSAGGGGSSGRKGSGGSANTGGSSGTAAGGSGGSSGRAGSSGGTGTGGSFSDASVDAAGFCVGTPVAGTCLATFFAPAHACFQPTGSCVAQTTSTTKNACWANGEKLLLQLGSQGDGFTYRNGGQLCFYGSWEYMNGTEKGYTFTTDGNALLVYNRSTGETVCADGSRTTLAPDFGGCAAIVSLVDIDVSGCTSGGCLP